MARGSVPSHFLALFQGVAFLVAPELAAQGEIHQFVGAVSGDQLGWSVGAAGDVNQDGHADVVVGVRFADGNGFDSGTVHVYSGKDGSALHSFHGDQAKDGLGVSVDGAGDVDADGFPDIIAGASDANFGAGMARVYSGKDGQVLHTFVIGGGVGGFGFSVSGGGDLNNDGHADLVVGALFQSSVGHESGRTYAFSGKDGASLFQFDGGVSGYWEGYSVDGPGDVSNDGFPDVLSSAPHAPHNGVFEVGRVVVLDGTNGSVVQVNYGDQGLETMGVSLSGVGDVDNDGVADYSAGSPTYSALQIPDAGHLRTYSGASGGLLWEVDGGGIGGNLGQSVSGAGDVNADGFDDVIGGAPGDNSGFPVAGNARVYSGSDGAVIATLPGDPFLSEFGYSVAGIGDANLDGTPDLLVGAPDGILGGLGSGHARIISGACLQSGGYGAGSVGSGGFVPELITVGGLPSLGNTGFGLAVKNGIGGAPAALVLGVAPTALTVNWGVFLVDPSLPFLVVPIGLGGAQGVIGTGQAQIQAPIPNNVALSGAVACIQVLIGDAGSSGGISATAGVRIVLCQ